MKPLKLLEKTCKHRHYCITLKTLKECIKKCRYYNKPLTQIFQIPTIINKITLPKTPKQCMKSLETLTPTTSKTTDSTCTLCAHYIFNCKGRTKT